MAGTAPRLSNVVISQNLGVTNLIRRARSRMEKSKQYRQSIEDIEYNLDLNTGNEA